MNIPLLQELAEAIKNGVPDEKDLARCELGEALPSILAYIEASERLVEAVKVNVGENDAAIIETFWQRDVPFLLARLGPVNAALASFNQEIEKL